ncbi:hypothetical protein M0802_011698 [Mischocyttarus mexicanus]|nr:hypothetical protein M0802_011698 [Mischocyttarus mexicanus]
MTTTTDSNTGFNSYCIMRESSLLLPVLGDSKSGNVIQQGCIELAGPCKSSSKVNPAKKFIRFVKLCRFYDFDDFDDFT